MEAGPDLPLCRPHRVMSKKTNTRGKSIRSLMRKPRPIAVSGAITTDTPRQHKEVNNVPKKPSLSLIISIKGLSSADLSLRLSALFRLDLGQHSNRQVFRL